MKGITTKALSYLQKALLTLEEAIPPGGPDLGGKIDKEITRARRLYLSESNTDDLVDWLEIGVSELGDDAASATFLDSGCLQFEDLTAGSTDPCSDATDAQDALRRFHDTLRSCWPVQCEHRHQAMLKLVADRQDLSGEGGPAETFEFDTLLSTHSQCWGRVRFWAE